MKRTAQLGYSNLHGDVYYGKSNRERKALTMVAILQDYMGNKLESSTILDVDKLIPTLMGAIEKRLDFDRGMIMLSNKEKTRLIYTSIELVII